MGQARRPPGWAILLSVLLASGPAAAEAVEIRGSLDVAGDLIVSAPEGGVVFADGSRQTSAAISGRRIRVVGPVGTADENGAALLAALAGIPGADADNPWLLKVEPGTYDLGFDSLEMIPFVDIEGSGEDLTRIRGRIEGNTSLHGVVRGASEAELRFLSVVHAGGAIDAIGLSIHDASPAVTRVRISASGATAKNIGVYSSNASPLLRGLTVAASGGDEAYGVWNANSSPAMTGGRITASAATLKNVGVFNANSGSAGPTMELLTITGAGGNENIGVRDSGGNSVMHHLIIVASGGTDNIGIRLMSSATPSIRMATIRAEGGSNLNHGIYSSYARPQIVGADVLASGGKFASGIYIAHEDLALEDVKVAALNGKVINRGIRCEYASLTLVGLDVLAAGSGALNTALDADSDGDTLTVSRSRFKASGYGVHLSAAVTLNMGASQLDGPIGTVGTWHCAGCCDGSFTALGPDCQ